MTDHPVSPRARRLQALERGDGNVSDDNSKHRRPLHLHSTKTSHHKDRRRRQLEHTPSSPWVELCGAASPTTILRLLLMLGVLLVVLDITIESLALAYCPQQPHYRDTWLARLLPPPPSENLVQPTDTTTSCSPGVIDLAAIGASRSRHRFYDLLERRGPPTPPVFTDDFQVLCEAGVRHQSRFGYCLPIGGRTDEPFCARADRMDLLVPGINATTFCYASVLHMLLIDVYEELEALDVDPRIAYGTLLGAVRNGSMISYTEDADIAYTPLAPVELEQLRDRLWAKGLHLFHFTRVWRVCVAPTHPLASVLFTPEKGLTRNYKVPYVDLYEMKAVKYDDGTWWDLFGTADDRLLPDEKVNPISHIHINGLAFNTFADPVDFLTDEYGPDFWTPVARPQKKSNGFNFHEAFLENDEPDLATSTKKQNTRKSEQG